jgi:6-phosphogluconolactonase (cycloisomerase 2 family)
MVLQDIRQTSSKIGMLPIWLMAAVLLIPGCGDGGGEGGFGGVGAGGPGTIGGVATISIVYVTNSGSNDVSGYAINATTGGLSAVPGSPFTNVSAPSAIAVSSDGFFAFAANSQSNNVTAFRVGMDGGLLPVSPTPSTPNPAPVGTAPRAIAISKDAQFVYVANSRSDSVTVLSVGAAGALTRTPEADGTPNPVGAGGSSPAAIAISPSGRFLYVANSTSNTVAAFQIDANGLLKLIPPTGPATNPIPVSGTAPTALAMTFTGQFLYATNSASNTVSVFQVESSGLLTLVPPAGTGTNPVPIGGTSPNGIAVARNGRFLYTANGGGNVSTFSIGGNGLLTLLPSSGSSPNPIPAGTNPSAITISQDGQFLYVTNRGGGVSAYTVVSETGSLIPLTPLLGNPFPTGTAPSGIATPSRL